MSKNTRQEANNVFAQGSPSLSLVAPGITAGSPADHQSDHLAASSQVGESGRLSFLKQWRVIGLLGLLTLGAMGAGMKYLEDSAKRQKAESKNSAGGQNASLLSALNPFVEPPLPTATPQLAREYLYSGSRLLAVQDANASAAPPADIAVWRPSTGVWHVLGGQGSQATSVVQFEQHGLQRQRQRDRYRTAFICHLPN